MGLFYQLSGQKKAEDLTLQPGNRVTDRKIGKTSIFLSSHISVDLPLPSFASLRLGAFA
jgi:hypothetical protein